MSRSTNAPLLLFLGGVLLLGSLWVPPGAAAGTPKPNPARAILARMTARYAALNSYQDTGEVRTTYDEATSGRITKMPFKTYFKRPNFFRFEWIDYDPWRDGRTYMIWSNGKDAFTYWQTGTFEKEESLEMAIAGATGISNGAAHTVSGMLMNGIGLSFLDLKDPVALGEEQLDGQLCYHLRAAHPRGTRTYEIWIGKKDFLLRKIQSQEKSTDYTRIKEEIHSNIRVNQPIADSTFDFKPPIALTTPDSKNDSKSLPSEEAPSWSEFTSEEGRFKVLMPGMPTSQTVTYEASGSKISHRSFVASKGGVTCIVDFADFPKTMVDPGNPKPLFDKALEQFLAQSGAKLSTETTISYEGNPGREITLNLLGGSGKLRFYMIGQRFYQLAIIEVNLSDEKTDLVEKFFSSFKITPEPKTIARH